jgi:hypothetical protein
MFEFNYAERGDKNVGENLEKLLSCSKVEYMKRQEA